MEKPLPDVTALTCDTDELGPDSRDTESDRSRLDFVGHKRPVSDGSNFHRTHIPSQTLPRFKHRVKVANLMPPWKDNEVEEVFTRSSGPGGQHVNKVSTAVTLRHLPTGLTVRSSNSRSQARNREEASRLLAEKIHAAAALAEQSALAEISRERRRKARRSLGTKKRLVEGKRRRAETKQLRSRVSV